MLRYINILLSAALLLASCTKTEVEYDTPSAIALSPVAEGMTKAAVEGEDYVGDLNFNVFAQTSDGKSYFNNVSFEPTSKTSEGLTVYEGNPMQYWPRTKNLVFAGYTGTSSSKTAMNSSFTELSITTYQQETGNDLMYFFDLGDAGKGYNSTSGVLSPTMKHACSWITINITGESACNDWPIKGITLQGISKSGNVTFSRTGVEWKNLATGVDEKIFNGSATISTSPSAEAIVIPQDPVYIIVEYKDDKKTEPISLQYNGNAEWQPGIHYTYTLHLKKPYVIEFGVSGVSEWDADLNNNNKDDDTIVIQ